MLRVGDDQLNYYGISYGSYIGETYANLFPGKVRAVIIDGVIDPIGWSTGHGDDARTMPAVRSTLDWSAVKSLLPDGAMRICTDWSRDPEGIRVASNGRFTWTGRKKVCPSGPA